MKSFKLRVLAQVLPFLLVAPALAPAQTPPSRSEAMAAMKTGQQQAGTQYTRQQIDQLIAPVALYPDQLLAQVLMAATYPQQLLEASDWLQDPTHAALKGDELAQALAELPWDPSVKALVAFPPVIAMMTEHIQWTESLGLAFATQQSQVMSRVQALRQLALNSGRIKNIKHVTVRKQGDVIEIVSAEPDRVFVPVYNPTVVYGHWPDPDTPPVYVVPPRRFASETRETMFETVEPGIEVYSYPVVQPLWGWTRPDWRSDRISIETEEYTRITRSAPPPPDHYWRHEGPIVTIAPAAAPRPSAPPVAVPSGTVAPAQAVAVGSLQERIASHPDKIRVETSAAAPTAGPQRPGAPAEAQRNQQGSGKDQPAAGGAPPAAGNAAPTRTAQPEKTQGQQPQPDRGQAQQLQPEKAQTQHPQAEKAQAQHPQAGTTQAQRPQAQQPQTEKARTQQPQPEKPQGQHPQPEKAQTQHPQAERAQIQQPQPEKSPTQHSQAEKPQAQHPPAGTTQAQRPQAVQPPAQHPQAERPQAQHPQAGTTQAQRPQAVQPPAQHPQAERPQAQHPQAEKAQAQHPEAAAKPQAEKAPAQSHAPANAAAPAGAAPKQAGTAAGRPQGAGGETHGQGSSAPPRPAASPPGHETAAERHAPPPHPAANQPAATQNETDKKEH